jgi:hypothetical protein
VEAQSAIRRRRRLPLLDCSVCPGPTFQLYRDGP